MTNLASWLALAEAVSMAPLAESDEPVALRSVPRPELQARPRVARALSRADLRDVLVGTRAV